MWRDVEIGARGDATVGSVRVVGGLS